MRPPLLKLLPFETKTPATKTTQARSASDVGASSEYTPGTRYSFSSIWGVLRVRARVCPQVASVVFDTVASLCSRRFYLITLPVRWWVGDFETRKPCRLNVLPVILQIRPSSKLIFSLRFLALFLIPEHAFPALYGRKAALTPFAYDDAGSYKPSPKDGDYEAPVRCPIGDFPTFVIVQFALKERTERFANLRAHFKLGSRSDHFSSHFEGDGIALTRRN